MECLVEEGEMAEEEQEDPEDLLVTNALLLDL